MKLTFYPYELKLRNVFTVSSYSRSSTPGIQVEIHYEGITGYGEASMPPYLGESTQSVLDFFKVVDLNQFEDPFLLEDILEYIDKIKPGNTAAKAAIDIALHDLVGKLSGSPCWKLFGLNKAKCPVTSYTIGIDTPQKMKEKVCEVDGHFKLLKVKLGTNQDQDIIKAIRSVSNLPIAVDANQGWEDKHYALDMIHWLKENGVVMIEQPMPKTRNDDTAWVTSQSPLPIFADESVQRLQDILALKDVFTGINIKLMKCTGIREAFKMINFAKTIGMKTMLGCMTETSCAISAAAQLSPLVDFADLDGNLLISNDLFEGMKIDEGKIRLNDLPGIGIEKTH